MKVFWSPHFVLPLPASHRFPMRKYSRLHERVLAEQVVQAQQVVAPSSAGDGAILRAHEAGYLERLEHDELGAKEARRIGFPVTPELVQRERLVVGATIDACRAAADSGLAVNLAGGTHHAHAGWGAGYCVFNDAAVAARAAQAEGSARRVLVVDCDVHQGDGTAAIFAGDSSVWTFSMHGARNYPFRKQHSDLDVALEDGTGDDEYLSALRDGLARSLAAGRPELAIYLAGADPFSGDALGRLALSMVGLAERDALVLGTLREQGVPVAITMAGGYAPDIEQIVEIHLATIRIAARIP